MSEILTLTDATRLGFVLEAPQFNRAVARLMHGNVLIGTARSVGDENGCSVHKGDVRDQYLRVTLDSGFEAFWPIRELIREVASGEFVPDYQR